MSLWDEQKEALFPLWLQAKHTRFPAFVRYKTFAELLVTSGCTRIEAKLLSVHFTAALGAVAVRCRSRRGCLYTDKKPPHTAHAAARAVALISLIYPLPTKVVGAPQMISQPDSSIFPCSPLPCGTWRTPGLSISWCCLPTSSSVCLVFFPLSLCLARWFWPDLMNGRHDHTTEVCVSWRWSRRSSCGPIACWILAVAQLMF